VSQDGAYLFGSKGGEEMIEWAIAVGVGLLAYFAGRFIWWSLNDEAFFDGGYYEEEEQDNDSRNN
jgi:membrane-bound inhibitor of C-type lysozyme